MSTYAGDISQALFYTNVYEYVSILVCYADLTSFGYISKSGISGSYVSLFVVLGEISMLISIIYISLFSPMTLFHYLSSGYFVVG